MVLQKQAGARGMGPIMGEHVLSLQAQAAISTHLSCTELKQDLCQLPAMGPSLTPIRAPRLHSHTYAHTGPASD